MRDQDEEEYLDSLIGKALANGRKGPERVEYHGPFTVDELQMSPVLREVERRRLLTERSGLRHDMMAEIEFHAFKQMASLWPEVYAWPNSSAEDAPMLHGRLARTRQNEWIIFGQGGFWAVRKSHWTLVGVRLEG